MGWLPSVRVNAPAVVVAGFIYVIGGWNGGPLADIDRAEIHADGSLGPWESMSPLTMPRNNHAGAAVGSHLYALSGDLPANTGPVEFTSILNVTPTTKDECKDGGWAFFSMPRFRNQGQCVSLVTQHSAP